MDADGDYSLLIDLTNIATIDGEVGLLQQSVDWSIDTSPPTLLSMKEYKEGVTNSTKNIENYATSEQKALAFGVYGADMNYNSIYERNQEMAHGLIAIKKLSGDLGLDYLFDQASFERFENIKTNADSVKLGFSKANAAAYGSFAGCALRRQRVQSG